jgi:hypothetical protein
LSGVDVGSGVVAGLDSGAGAVDDSKLVVVVCV